MAEPKPLMTQLGIHHRLESGEIAFPLKYLVVNVSLMRNSEGQKNGKHFSWHAII